VLIVGSQGGLAAAREKYQCGMQRVSFVVVDGGSDVGVRIRRMFPVGLREAPSCEAVGVDGWLPRIEGRRKSGRNGRGPRAGVGGCWHFFCWSCNQEHRTDDAMHALGWEVLGQGLKSPQCCGGYAIWRSPPHWHLQRRKRPKAWGPCVKLTGAESTGAQVAARR
jgi:hypothetical protein